MIPEYMVYIIIYMNEYTYSIISNIMASNDNFFIDINIYKQLHLIDLGEGTKSLEIIGDARNWIRKHMVYIKTNLYDHVYLYYLKNT